MKSTKVMSSLKRITTEYIELEDRIRLAGLIEDNQTVSIWLTMRLLRRLISHCINLVDENTPELKTSLNRNEQSSKSLKNFVQQSAKQQIVAETPVIVRENSPNHHAVEVDIKNDRAGVSITFKGEFSSSYSIYLNNEQLRQWLAMLHMIWQKAEWPALIWPDWMSSSSLETASGTTSIH